MKKIILTVAALAAFGTASAQVKFGAKAGLNLANISESYDGYGEDYDGDYKMKVGAHVGAFVEWKFTEKFALQPELLFSMQGAKFEQSEGDDGFGNSYSTESKVNLNYINVPIMVKFYPIPKLFIEAGPQVGFLMSAKSKDETSVTTGGTTVTESETVDVKDGFKSIDFGVNVGVGYEFTEMIYANLRYNIGLSDITESDDSDEFEDVDFGAYGDVFKTRNNVLSLSVGFKF